MKELRTKAMALPLSPGVYIMKNKRGEIIYIGKAKALKNRVSRYFGSQNGHNMKVRMMVENVDTFDYIIVNSEFEALVLECSLIKRNMPKYNILLKDSAGYSYIKITPNPWGNISPVFKKSDSDPKGTRYVGPYMSYFMISNAIDEAKEIFRLPRCSKQFPRDIGKERPCLNYHMKKCAAPCAGKINRERYEKNLADAIEFLKNGSKSVIRDLTKKMLEASENLEFELAATYRNRIRSIERIRSRQKVVTSQTKNRDVFAIAQSNENSCLAVLSFRDGLLCNTEHFIFDASESLPQTRKELIVAYYIQNREIPPVILVDGATEDEEILCQYLADKRQKSVKITVPQKGESEKLVQMCLLNASQKLGDYIGRKGAEVAALDELAKILKLPKVPRLIESYDISHTNGADNVAGMIVFKDGKPFKSAYKKFTIKGFSGRDDYGSMREVVFRRLTEYQNEVDEGIENGKWELPDLVLLDGGQGQVNAVKPVFDAFGIDVPIFGMVKDNKHRTRAIATGGEEVSIRDGRRVFTLVSNIREEVHRFAISFHKKKHSKSTIQTELEKIDGIGMKKAQLLLKHFKTMTALKNATEGEIAEIKGISKTDAKNIADWFKNK